MAEEENIHGKHRERMRERFSRAGFDNYRPHEVIEQLLFDVRPRVNTNPAAHRLINRFGGVGEVLEAPCGELEKVDEVGERSADYLASVRDEVGRVICEQYRTMEAVSTEMTAFLADWFMREDNGGTGLVVCDADGVFREWKMLDFHFDEGGTFDSARIAKEIAASVGGGKYILVFREGTKVSLSSLYRMIDAARDGDSKVLNVYRMEGHKPVSLLFSEPERNSFSVWIERFAEKQKKDK